MNTNKIVVLLMVAMSCHSFLFSQSLLDRLEGKNNFNEICSIAEKYYNDVNNNRIISNPLDPKYKHWKRWEWSNQNRLDKDGNIFNYHLANYKALKLQEENNSSSQQSTNSLWTFTGPNAHVSSPSSTKRIGLGRIDRIAFHPTNSNIIFLGTPNGGIWKTLDGGINWLPLTDFLPTLGISEIIISHSNPNLIYALTGTGDGLGNGYATYGIGVVKSLDGGTTWSKTSNFVDPNTVGYHMAMDPNNDQILFAATTKGLHKTQDGGNTWFKIDGSSEMFDVKFKPGSSDTLYTCDKNFVYYSYFGGSSGTWKLGTVSIPLLTGRKTIAVTPANKEAVYLLSGPGNLSGTFGGVYRSINAGGFYQRQSNSPDILGPQSGYDQCMAISNDLQNIVMVGGILIYRSINSGVGWSNVIEYDNNTTVEKYVHHDIHDMKFNPLNNYLYAATDGGFYRSTDLGTNWTNLSTGLGTGMFYNIAGYNAIPNYILCGAQDNGIKYRKNNTAAFDHIADNDGFDVEFAYTDSSRFYATINSGVYKYRNNGDSVVEILNGPFFQVLGLHQSNPDILFAGKGNLQKTIDAGVNWTTISILADRAITTCPSNHNRVYVAGSNRLFRLENLGESFVRLDTNPGAPPDTVVFTDIQVSPLNSAIVYAAVGGFDEGEKVYKSVDFGGNWTNISGSLANVPVNCLAILANGDVYAGTDIGVYYLSNGAGDWIPFKNGLPNATVTDLLVNTNSNIIRASIFGRGVWTAPLADGNCVPDLIWTVTTALTGYHYFEAAQTIQNKSIISGGISTNVFLKAGNYIDLKDGFQAKADGLIFNASIGPCTGGGIPTLKKIVEVKKE